MIEFDINAKDYIKLNFLSEVINTSSIEFFLFLETDNVEKKFRDIRGEKSVYRFNNFNVSEDITQNVITFRPVVIGCYLYFRIITDISVKIDIIKNGTTTVAKEFHIPAGETKIEFEPQGTQRYIVKLKESVLGESLHRGTEENTIQPVSDVTVRQNLDPFLNPFGEFDSFANLTSLQDVSHAQKVEERKAENNRNTSPSSISDFSTSMRDVTVAANSGGGNGNRRDYEERVNQLESSNSRLEADIRDLETKIQMLENRNESLVLNKKRLIEHMDKLQAECDRNYQNYKEDVEEIKLKYSIDSEILRMYAGKNDASVDDLLQRAESDISQIEEKIKIFIEAQERKTADIEEELKIGKKES